MDIRCAVLVEKILREQPGVGQLYLLIRPLSQKHKSSEQRLIDDVSVSASYCSQVSKVHKENGFVLKNVLCNKFYNTEFTPTAGLCMTSSN